MINCIPIYFYFYFILLKTISKIWNISLVVNGMLGKGSL